MMPLNRKNLPPFGKINKTVNIDLLKQYCIDHGYADYARFNDMKYSAGTNYQAFLTTHAFCKDTFFKETEAASLEGEKYKQLYLTEIDSANLVNTEDEIKKTNATIFSRVKRQLKNSENYISESDELNYTVKNTHVKGIFEEIINMFTSQVTRVRLAVLMPEFEIKPHVDYDPSHITRYHIPIFTSDKVIFGVKHKSKNVEFQMPNDGSIYFLNSGLLHWVKNKSNEPRLHLIIDTHGQNDLIFKS